MTSSTSSSVSIKSESENTLSVIIKDEGGITVFESFFDGIKRQLHIKNEQIGKGIQGKVYFGKTNQDIKIALKKSTECLVELEKKRMKADFENEARILSHLKELVAYHYNPETKEHFLFKIEAEGQAVFSMLYKIKEDNEKLSFEKLNVNKEDAMQIAFSGFKALYILHLLGVIHRDVKPENAIYNGLTKTVKFVDFGAACFPVEADRINHGTLGYGRPLNGSGEQYMSDYYSWAIVAWELLSKSGNYREYIESSKQVNFDLSDFRIVFSDLFGKIDSINARKNDLAKAEANKSALEAHIRDLDFIQKERSRIEKIKQKIEKFDIVDTNIQNQKILNDNISEIEEQLKQNKLFLKEINKKIQESHKASKILSKGLSKEEKLKREKLELREKYAKEAEDEIEKLEAKIIHDRDMLKAHFSEEYRIKKLEEARKKIEQLLLNIAQERQYLKHPDIRILELTRDCTDENPNKHPLHMDMKKDLDKIENALNRRSQDQVNTNALK